MEKTPSDLIDEYMYGLGKTVDERIKHRINLIKINAETNVKSCDVINNILKENGYKLNSTSNNSTPSTLTQAAQYARAELTHATQGPASEADAAARLAICMACEHRAVEYKGQTDAGGVGWCTKCGCGNNPRAMLTVKVTLAGVECPLAKWGKVEGTGATVASAVDAVAGVAKSIIHKLSGG